MIFVFIDFSVNRVANVLNELFTYPCNLEGLRKYRILRNFAKTFDRINANKNTGQKSRRRRLLHFVPGRSSA